MKPVKNKSKLVLVLSLATVITVLALSLLSAGYDLIVIPLHSKMPLLRMPIEPGQYFIIQYLHSVNGFPVWDVHAIDKRGNIYLKEERFLAFSAGMGHWPGHGKHVIRDGIQVIEDINEPIGSFVLRIGGMTSPHTIICGDTVVNLSRMAAGKPLRVDTATVSTLQRMLRQILSSSTWVNRDGGS
jgi:hypothetical protein